MRSDKTSYELAVELGRVAGEKGLTVATAESCTAGGVGFEITAVPGSSAWYDRGFVTYTNEAKREMLGVKAETLEAFGAVSCETAREMALGALNHSEADVSVSVTGIAGPGGEVPGKPVGTVCFASAVSDGKGVRIVTDVRMQFAGNRDAVRRQSIDFAVKLLIEAARASAK
jgi:competence/damage-inducible protein cinA C-terminal domain